MLELKQQNCFFIFNYNHQLENQQQFFTPHFWQAENRIIGSAKGRGTTWFIETLDLFGINCALRHYYRGGFWKKLNKDRYQFNGLTKTRSFAEFYLLDELYRQNFPVPKPIGARVEKCGFNYYRADILTEKIEDAQDLTAFLQHQKISSQGWQQIGNLISRLHQLQICHTDLNAHNILVQHGGTSAENYWLLDFDKCSKKNGNHWKHKNLQRLHRSFQKEICRLGIQFCSTDWFHLMLGYENYTASYSD